MNDELMNRFRLKDPHKGGEVKAAWQAMSRMTQQVDEGSKTVTITVHYVGSDLVTRVGRLAGLHAQPGWTCRVLLAPDDGEFGLAAEDLKAEGFAHEDGDSYVKVMG
ncbi:hypothetical protein SAMN02745687_02011 [Lachnospiraceae bacterium NK3A20]|nr:hypothetical protein SAMN02745687_02011 [Lachnospiraceae bacterium NK3A20]